MCFVKTAFILTVALFCAPAGRAYATTVIAVWTPSAIIMGADSLTHTLDDTKRWSVCKIGRADRIVWSQTGIVGNPDFGFDLQRLAGEAMAGSGSLDAKVLRIESAIASALAEIVEDIRVDNPEWYALHAEGLPVTRVLFAAYEDGHAILRLRDFVAKSSRLGAAVDINVERTDCPGPMCGEFRAFLLGQFDYAGKVASEPGYWEKRGAPEGVRAAIDAEIAGNPDHVGSPITIAEISRDGARWVETGACADK
jgi:hypothetical protein